MKIWSQDYNPMLMGGNVDAPMETDAPVIETREIEGFKLHLVVNPQTSKFQIADDVSGGLVSEPHATIEEAWDAVTDDIRDGLERMGEDGMRHQLETQKQQGATARPVEPAVFWGKIGRKHSDTAEAAPR